jgi:hypothetical protein
MISLEFQSCSVHHVCQRLASKSKSSHLLLVTQVIARFLSALGVYNVIQSTSILKYRPFLEISLAFQKGLYFEKDVM